MKHVMTIALNFPVNKKTVAAALILAFLFSVVVGVLVVEVAKANPYPYTNCGSSFVTVSVLSPENKTYETNSILVTITAGAYPGVWYVGYSVDDRPFIELAPGHALGHTFNESVWLNPLSKGSHNIIVEATAMANNPEGKVTAFSQVYFTVAKEIEPHDSTAPEITLVSPENKTYYKTGIPLNFSVNELDCWIRYKLDAQDAIEISGNTTLIGFFYGSHSLTVYATDAAGNTGDKTVVFTLAKPEDTNPSPEPFPATLLIATVVLVAMIGIGLLVYFKKRNRKG
jgi:hypothetical protein